jgi:hypothetical protein
MTGKIETAEYLAEIRKQVCSRCPERPPGGPPCAPLGKTCGVEAHLEALLDSIHQVSSPLLEPYLAHNRDHICEQCAFLHSSICPCPMDYLAALVVEAVEAVDERHKHQVEAGEGLPRPAPVALSEIRVAYQQAAGTWAGCDWNTFFGKGGLNLNGWKAAEARAISLSITNPAEAEDWKQAADWLGQVEQRARQAQMRAAEAVRAAEAGLWEEALHNAEWAWALEFSTGRPLRHGRPLAWQNLRALIEAAYQAVRDLVPA